MKTRIKDSTRLKRNLGIGDKEDYKSFIQPRDFSANSRVHRIAGHTIERPYVILSDLERSHFIYFDFSSNVKDIREQFPLLPLKKTQSIAAECQIKHPQNEKGEDVIMTTDFVLTIQQEGNEVLVAVSVKPASKLNKRTIEKMQIEKEYWNSQGVKWVLVTDNQVDKILNNNLSFFREHYTIQKSYANEILDILKKESSNPILKDIIPEIARTLKIKNGDVMQNIHHLLARKRIQIDYYKSFNFNFHLKDLNLN
jgi:hypothetical protein